MSKWIPAEEREHLASFYGDMPHRLNRNYAPDDVRKLLDHATEADRRIKERDDLLNRMADALKSLDELYEIPSNNKSQISKFEHLRWKVAKPFAEFNAQKRDNQ